MLAQSSAQTSNLIPSKLLTLDFHRMSSPSAAEVQRAAEKVLNSQPRDRLRCLSVKSAVMAQPDRYEAGKSAMESASS
jgi:hypothetical protein